LAKNGMKELILIARFNLLRIRYLQEKSTWRITRTLVQVEGIEWIRLHYSFYWFPMDVLEIMKREPKICNYYIPLQHISDLF
jgi:ribosomal protein S12 methylthiotransferase